MFIAMLFAIAKTWIQSKCSVTDEWIKKRRYNNGMLFSHKKNEIMPLAETQMDLEIITLNLVSQVDTDKCHRYLLYVEAN